jgi:Tol biopolymer transport system component/mono/diheme cytochrome c family protein
MQQPPCFLCDLGDFCPASRDEILSPLQRFLHGFFLLGLLLVGYASSPSESLAAGPVAPQEATSANPKPKIENPKSDYGTVESIFQQKCLACHSSATKMGGLVLESYQTLVKGGAHGPAVVAGKSEESRMVLMLEGKIQPRMPFGGEPLPAEEIASIKGWIDAGANGPPLGTPLTSASPKAVIPDIRPSVPVVSPVGSIAFSPDGKLLAVGGYKDVRLMDAASSKVVETLSGHADVVRALAFTPDGTKLAAAGGLPARSGEIKVWDAQTHRLLETMTGHKDCIYSIAISPDGKLLASGSYDKLILLWDIGSGKQLRTLKDHIDAVFSVAFSPDGKRLASGAQDRSVKIWEVATGQRLFTLSEPLDGVVAVAFRPSGTQLAAGGYDKVIRTWDLTDKGGTLAQSMIAHEDMILQLAYSPDGKTLISTSADRTIRFWDAETLSSLKALDKQPDWVQAMSVSPDGKWLAAGRYDGSVSVYNLATYQQVLGPIVAFAIHQPTAEQKAESASR